MPAKIAGPNKRFMDEKDAVDLTRRRVDDIKKYRAKIAKKKLEMDEKGIPFCTLCANQHYQKILSNYRDKRRKFFSGAGKKPEVPSTGINLEDFAGKYLEKVKITREKEKRLIDGTTVNYSVYFKDYKCPEGHNVSIQMPDGWKPESEKKKDEQIKKASKTTSKKSGKEKKSKK